MSKLETFTTPQAAAMLGWSVDKLNRTGKDIFPQARNAGKSQVKLYNYRHLRFFLFNRAFDKMLTPSGRKSLFASISKLPIDETHVMVGNVPIDLSAVDRELELSIQKLHDVSSGIVERGGDAYFAGSDISVYRVAALATGQTTAEILEDYPGLSPDQVSKAVDYSLAQPKKGKPYPSRSLKRMLGDLAALGPFDDDDAYETMK